MPSAQPVSTPTTERPAGSAAQARRPLLSLILCSRNDQFQGNSLWRLEMTLNYTAAKVAELGRLDDVEIIVADWGSENTLREHTRLTKEAAAIVRFMMIPTPLAKEKQKDSPFAEVFAINAAARRSRGAYIGRIDQDTLVGKHFLEWFFAKCAVEGSPTAKSVMISNRRRVPYHFAVKCPDFPIVEKYVDMGARKLPEMFAPPPETYWECYIGVFLFSRELWEASGGYDETFLYYGFMEFDLFLRLRMHYEGINLSEAVDTDFYHLDHVPMWAVWKKLARAGNPMRTPENPPPEFAPNGEAWGLRDYDLALEPSPGGHLLMSEQESRWSGAYLGRLVGDTVSSTVQTFVHLAREEGAEFPKMMLRPIKRLLTGRPASRHGVHRDSIAQSGNGSA